MHGSSANASASKPKSRRSVRGGRPRAANGSAAVPSLPQAAKTPATATRWRHEKTRLPNAGKTGIAPAQRRNAIAQFLPSKDVASGTNGAGLLARGRSAHLPGAFAPVVCRAVYAEVALRPL